MASNGKQFPAPDPEMTGADGALIGKMPIEEIGLTVACILLAGIWCATANEVLDRLLGAPLHSLARQMLKGTNFAATTSLVVCLVLRRCFRRQELAQEAARLSQERFESVALAVTQAIWDWDLDTNTVWWSKGIQKVFGYHPEEVTSQFEWWLERLHAEDTDRVIRAIRQAIDSGSRTWAGHYRFLRKDGSYAAVLDHGYILHNADGRPVRVIGGIRDISERRKAEEALKNSRRRLRALSARLQSAREEERASVAREIHDELGQVLTAIKLNLDWLERKIGEREHDRSLNPVLDRVVESGEMIDSAIHSVQRIATDLRPGLLDHLGLAAALRQEASRFQKRSGIACTLQLPPDSLGLPRDAATALFRIVQEALTNVGRHAQATTVHITLDADAKHVVLQVEDNGRGIHPEAVADSRSVGLLGMQERASVLGGELGIEPITPSGSRITLRLPRTADTTKFWADL